MMADAILVLIIVVFFALCAAYVIGCERIIRSDGQAGEAGDATIADKAVR
jgi:hypothetical protein